MKKIYLALCWAMASAPVWSQVSAPNATSTYPSRPVSLVVPFSTGTGADLLARLLGPKLAERWKVSVVTDRPLSRSEYFEIFLATLRSNGLVAVPGPNGSYRVQPIDGAAALPAGSKALAGFVTGPAATINARCQIGLK